MNKDVIIACDFASRKDLLGFLDRFGSRKPYLKVGMELFYAEGPSIVRELKDRGHRVFLDLKLHDIPNTVRKAMRVLSGLGVDMCNVHAAGTRAMMEAALEGLTRPDGSRPLLIAVTQLTSTSPQMLHDELLVEEPMEETVMSYASNARSAGLDGVVCSPLEAGLVKAVCGKGFLTVTPGIRYPDASKDDQQRVTDPEGARALGSDYIVVGRQITSAPDPEAMCEKCLKDFLGL